MNRLLAGLLVGIICLSTTALFQEAYGQSPSGAGTKSAQAMVVFATQDISRGQIIGASVLEVKQTDAAKLPKDVVSSVKYAVGKRAKDDIVKGQIICTHNLQ